jgi:large subunit ribosomal protein L21
MYAVIKTGGKQYRVSPGDLLVVEKLDGEPGKAVAFGDVLLLGDGEAVTVGAPLVAGASVAATLIETRKGDKVKIFKKIRRQGYRRTRGHRQEKASCASPASPPAARPPSGTAKSAWSPRPSWTRGPAAWTSRP